MGGGREIIADAMVEHSTHGALCVVGVLFNRLVFWVAW